MRLLRLGSEGPAVQLLQLALARAGQGALAVDGSFGAETRAALRRFQAERGLAPDGAAGPLTHRALLPWYTGFLVRRLRPGDTVRRVARSFCVGEEAILTANPGLDPERPPVGGELVVPLPFPVVPEQVDWFSALTAYCARGLAARYPFLAAGEIGKSVLGRPLWSLRLGGGEKRVLCAAGHHANEWLTTPALLRVAEELAAAFAAGGSIGGYPAAELLSRASLTLIPSLNPDGTDLVTGELRQGDAFERARRIAAAYPSIPFPSGWRANIRGVDLNLQYPAGWAQARRIKAALGVRGPAPADYVGPAPLSEPESRALYGHTRRLSPALVLALHSQGGEIYWQYRDFAPPEARALAGRFAAVSGYEAAETPYEASFAGWKDWFLQDFGRPGFTLELGRGRNPLPIGDLDGICRAVRGVLCLAALS